jgi:hypothetical protein
MAETKTTKAKSKTKAKAKSSKPKKAAASKASNGKANGAKAAAKSSSPKAGASSDNGSGNGNGVGAVVEKAKLPLIATGAVVAGAAAVMVGKNGHHKQRKVLGVPVPKRSKAHLPKVSVPKVGLPKGKGLKGDVRRAAGAVSDAAKQADQIGQRISKVASSVQAVSETTDKAAKKS